MFVETFRTFLCVYCNLLQSSLCVCLKAITNSHFLFSRMAKVQELYEKVGETIEYIYVKNYTLNYGRMQINKKKRNQRACRG